MRLRQILTLTLTATIAPALQYAAAAERGQWSEREIREMVTDSPWAREAGVTIKGYEGAFVDTPAGPAGAMGGETGEGARIGANATAGGLTAAPNIIVRWESAAPVCEACARGGLEKYLFSCYSKVMYLSGLQAKFDELSKTFYILSMSNYPRLSLGREGDAPQHSAASNAAMERMAERLRQKTLIRRKGRTPLMPAKALVLPAGQALLPVFFFSRTDSISLDDREVSFVSEGDAVEVRSKFNLRKMVWGGRLEL